MGSGRLHFLRSSKARFRSSALARSSERPPASAPVPPTLYQLPAAMETGAPRAKAGTVSERRQNGSSAIENKSSKPNVARLQ
jgi:hypothetical protein